MQIQIQESRFERYAQVLETTELRQIRRAFTDGKGGFCALGVLLKKFGGDFGEDGPTLGRIIPLNDGGMSFKQIAEWLRHH